MAAATAWSTDRLSHLSDDILTQILSFAPSREAARATALSRRWRRPLWLETGVVNVDYRSYAAASGDRRRAAVDDADHAYAFLCSRGRVPKKLSLVMPDDTIVCAAAGSTDVEEEEEEEETLEDSNGGVEDPRLEWLNNGGLPRCTLPFDVLKVLELTGYDLKPYSDDQRRQLAFPRLEAMRLRRCRTELATLQRILVAAPKLADVRLESLIFVDHDDDVYWLTCEAATVFVLENCGVLLNNLHLFGCNVWLHAPRLVQFRYTHVNAFHDDDSFRFRWDKPLLLDEAHLEVHSAASAAVNLWRSMLSDVSEVTQLKLTAYSIADLDIEVVPYFHRLQRLEIEELCGWSAMNHIAAAKAVMNLLDKCPALMELRVKFSWRKYLRDINADPADQLAAIADFPLCKSVENDDDEADCCKGLEELHWPFCCESSMGVLRRVVVQFDAMELTCFQVRLIRFLAKNATRYLEEFIVDGGKGYDSSCIDWKIARWRKRYQTPPPPLWPPSVSEFPSLEAPPTPAPSDEEIDVDDMFEMKEDIPVRNYIYIFEEEEEEEDDISPRHYLHSGRKKKKGSSPECFSVKPKTTEFIMTKWRREGAICHPHPLSNWRDENGHVTAAPPLATPSLPSVPMSSSPAETWTAPLLYEFPPLPRTRPPTSGRPPLCPTLPTSWKPPESPSLNHATPPAPPCSTTDTCASELI